jgi:hypothetical protein
LVASTATRANENIETKADAMIRDFGFAAYHQARRNGE